MAVIEYPKRLNKEEIKKQLIDSIANKDIIETKELNEKAGKVEKPEDAAEIKTQDEEIIRTKKKGLISRSVSSRKGV